MLMEVNGLKAEFNMPPAPEGEGKHGLPPYDRQPVWKVDEYPACPSNWEHGSGKASSYFTTLRPGHHMWFDFNMNRGYSHHIAVVCSIQGINPITGQQTKILRLEQYKNQCPEHKIDFKQDRFCEKCGYKWPTQNYLTTANSTLYDNGLFWIDGFRTQDGIVRGFLVSEETMKGVAAQLIGEDRVWAVGIAFYLSKEPWVRPAPKTVQYSGGPIKHKILPDKVWHAADSGTTLSASGSTKGMSYGHNLDAYYSEQITSDGIVEDLELHDGTVTCSASASPTRSAPRSRKIGARGVKGRRGPSGQSAHVPEVEVKKLEIAAGADIVQELDYPDPNNLDFYQEEPAGVIYMNFSDANSVDKIIAAGKRDLTAGGEGFLAPLNKGNPVKK